MALCPDDGRPLTARIDGALACGTCGGLFAPLAVVSQLAPHLDDALLAVETRTDSGGYARERSCPECAAILAPWRIGQMEAWADRCPHCEGYWLEKQDLRTLALVGRQRAFKGAYESFSPAERRQMARDLAEASGGEGYAIAPLHKFFAYGGLPVVRRTQGSRTPIATWVLAALLVGIFAFGRSQGIDLTAAWGYHASAPSLGSALTANFVHFGWLHLLGNVYFLLAFGDGVEQRVPRWGVVALFVLAGSVALASDGWLSGDGLIAGASGGIAAVMGACVLLQPQAKVLVGFFDHVFEVPIWTYGLFELVFQGLMAMVGISGTAWAAHLVGLGLGAAVGLAVRMRRPAPALQRNVNT